MTPPRSLFSRATLGLLLALIGTAALAASTPPAVPADSLYQLKAALTDQDARTFDFSAGHGKPRLISMFYADCPYMCPLLIDTIRKTEGELPEAARARLDVLLVSFDAERDTPAALKALAEKRRIDTARWTLARADAADVRRIAALLDIPFRQLADGSFSHAGVMILLDADGRVVARSETMGKLDPAFVTALTQTLSPATPSP
ncbi:MAG: SCO family protein [Xanthomonadales bacterium]|nr:SCO family protein [Xanthomonadales bacterium]